MFTVVEVTKEELAKLKEEKEIIDNIKVSLVKQKAILAFYKDNDKQPLRYKIVEISKFRHYWNLLKTKVKTLFSKQHPSLSKDTVQNRSHTPGIQRPLIQRRSHNPTNIL